MARNDGGLAFPRLAAFDEDGTLVSEDAKGMTLRQWYAGQALVGNIAALATQSYAKATLEAAERRGTTLPMQLAFECLEIAEAMIQAEAERERI